MQRMPNDAGAAIYYGWSAQEYEDVVAYRRAIHYEEQPVTRVSYYVELIDPATLPEDQDRVLLTAADMQIAGMIASRDSMANMALEHWDNIEGMTLLDVGSLVMFVSGVPYAYESDLENVQERWRRYVYPSPANPQAKWRLGQCSPCSPWAPRNPVFRSAGY